MGYPLGIYMIEYVIACKTLRHKFDCIPLSPNIGNDINKIDAVCFDYITASDTLAFYDYQTIPRILKKDVPSNISEVRFVCNITKLKDITTSNSFDKNDSQLFNSLF